MNNTILIKNVSLDGKPTDIYIEGNRFKKIGGAASQQAADTVIDGSGMAIVPPYYNAHTHASMTLMRGYADDIELFRWLNEYIWPFEAKITERDIYIGAKLACLEMIKSGTVFFNDMYWHCDNVWRAVDEMGMRACLGMTFVDSLDEKDIAYNFDLLQKNGTSDRIEYSVAPHAIYTVSEQLWHRCAEQARRVGARLHFHLSETRKEVDDCMAAHGTTPVRWLDKLGILGPDCIAAHVVHVDDEELALLRERGVTIVHNPISNMKLASGYFPTKRVIRSHCLVTLGTDGCSSNNNLDMREEAKVAALMAKCNYGPQTLPVDMVFDWATRNGARAFGIDAGEIAEGKLADAMLIRLDNERMVPCHNLISNLIYSVSNEAVDTVICNGRILMQGRRVAGEADIVAEARECCERIERVKSKE
ncbi:MAG: amidohydrolase [Bacteroidales bacterium]|nr:amidohydrolase [Bacteroidales bacterium]